MTSRSRSSTRGSREGNSSHQVFLSFRGDLRPFARKLQDKLAQSGIGAFLDDESMRPGKEIGSVILPAIRSARISIPMFTEEYSRSKWCLKELSEMVKCMDHNGQVILPVFYSVEPEAVKEVKWSIRSGFESHRKNNVDETTLREWETALRRVGRLKGWERRNGPNANEDELIKVVVSEVSNYFNGRY